MQERFHDKIRHTRKVNHKFNATTGKKWNNRSTSKHGIMDASEYRTDQEEQLDMTLNELFAIHEADVTGELLLKAGWSEIAEEPAEIFRRSRLVPDGVESHKEYKS